MKELKEIGRWCRQLWGKLATRCSGLVRDLREGWRVHVDRMLDEPGYASAIRNLIETVALVFQPAFLARFIADQAFTAYLAFLHMLRPPGRSADPNGFTWA